MARCRPCVSVTSTPCESCTDGYFTSVSAARVVRRRCEAVEREEVFALVVEHVLLLPVEILESEAVQRQRRAGVHPLADGRQRNLQQFRVEPRRRLRSLCEQNLHLLPLGVDLIVTLILIVPERRVIPDLLLELADVVAERQRRQQRSLP